MSDAFWFEVFGPRGEFMKISCQNSFHPYSVPIIYLSDPHVFHVLILPESKVTSTSMWWRIFCKISTNVSYVCVSLLSYISSLSQMYNSINTSHKFVRKIIYCRFCLTDTLVDHGTSLEWLIFWTNLRRNTWFSANITNECVAFCIVSEVWWTLPQWPTAYNDRLVSNATCLYRDIIFI